jgi:hypothetical protein
MKFYQVVVKFYLPTLGHVTFLISTNIKGVSSRENIILANNQAIIQYKMIRMVRRQIRIERIFNRQQMIFIFQVMNVKSGFLAS